MKNSYQKWLSPNYQEHQSSSPQHQAEYVLMPQDAHLQIHLSVGYFVFPQSEDPDLESLILLKLESLVLLKRDFPHHYPVPALTGPIKVARVIIYADRAAYEFPRTAVCLFGSLDTQMHRQFPRA